MIVAGAGYSQPCDVCVRLNSEFGTSVFYVCVSLSATAEASSRNTSQDTDQRASSSSYEKRSVCDVSIFRGNL